MTTICPSHPDRKAVKQKNQRKNTHPPPKKTQQKKQKYQLQGLMFRKWWSINFSEYKDPK